MITIVTPEEAGVTRRFAAKELKRYIERMTGAEALTYQSFI